MKAVLDDPIIPATLNCVESAKAELDRIDRSARHLLSPTLVCIILGLGNYRTDIHRVLWHSRHRKPA